MPSSTKKKTTRKRVSGDPAKRAKLDQKVDPDEKYAPSTWLTGGQGLLTDLTCPSGQLCLAKQPGVEGLMQAGVLRNVDSLTGLVQRKHLDPKGPGGMDMNSILQDDEALAEILHVVDRTVCFVVVKPEIQMTPADVTRRKPGVVYADMVEILDKMFIFNFAVGGSAELEPFRRGLEELVGSMEAESGVQPSAE